MDNGLLMSSLEWDIIDLAGHLRQERLFVSSEQQNLQGLNEKVVNASSRLAQLAWVTAQQRDNLNRLIVSRPDCTPAVCCHRANVLDNTIFVDGYKVLGFQECIAYGEFLQNLRTSPQLLASCLVAGDRLLPEMMHGIVHSIASGLFGSSLLPEDKVLVLKLLRYLTILQLVPSDNPRRLLRQKSCAFARLYAEFHESLFSAKLFLTAALHTPIMRLLVEHEMFLDIDPEKATVRFPPEDRLKKFGVEGTPEYNIRLQEYRRWTNNCLVTITNRFVKSLHDNMHCFPSGVSWIVRQIANLLLKSGKIEAKEVNAICTDLVFTYFICPAIVNPEPYGITDAHISYISRFNLIQVAKIVQTLAMTKYEEVDGKVADLYNLFEKDCVSSILDAILDDSSCDGEDSPAVTDSSKLQGMTRSAALFTEAELHNLVSFLQTVSSEVQQSEDEHHETLKKQLADWLSHLPHTLTVNGHTNMKAIKSIKPGNQVNTPPDTPRKSARLLGKVNRPKTASAALTAGLSDGNNNNSEDGVASQEEELNDKADVLVISFSAISGENIGLLAEQKVLTMDDCSSSIPVSLSANQDAGCVLERVESQEKRTRFSLSHDDGSIGNTSDNLEAVSEAASNHSVASSLELENEDQNDNLSDMVSANVSGRGTPNISGRDTPSSQITEGEEGLAGLRSASEEPRQSLHFPPSSSNKQSRSDIDDKFGKFEIKKLIEGDETVSLVSDTWSTDVLASDSETVEQSERNYPPSITESTIHQLSESTQLLDISETASEAWSTDVLASDSERFTEIDTDDTGSVARSEVEVDQRLDPVYGDITPPSSNTSLGLGVGFRACREDGLARSSLLVPASPTRADLSTQPSWNVTGRGGGKADYRRRTLEYIDNNANNIIHRRENLHEFSKEASQATSTEEMRLIHVIGEIDKPPDVKPAVVAASQASISIIHVPSALGNGATITETDNPALDHIPANHMAQRRDDSNPVIARPMPMLPSLNEVQMKQGELCDEELERPSVKDAVPSVVRLSSVSLASSSSSGSSSELRPKAALTGDIALPSAVIPNGHAGVVESEASVQKSATPHVSSSTGAIPKSISFDKTAEKGDKELLDDDQKHKRSFFRSFKFSLKNRKIKSLRGMDEMGSRFESSLLGIDGDAHSQGRLRRGLSDDGRSMHDTTEDILAKYRRKPSSGGESSASEPLPSTISQLKSKQPSDERLNIDRTNVEASYAFADAKRKLRMVLSTADLQHVPWMSHTRNIRSINENELVSFLQLQLAEAINLQDRSLIAHLHETLRCIRLFDEKDCRKLFHSLKEDYLKRSPYIAYLVRCRQGLLSTLAHLERLTERVKCDRQVCSRFLIAVCVTMFLEKREQMLFRFTSDFQQLTLADEKTYLLDNFLQSLAVEMEKDSIWQVASDSQLEQAQMVVERAVMSRVYLQALYPNGDGDISRDQVLHNHMEKLAAVITPNHKDLRIPKVFHYECPWPSAQAEISAISAYKTPRDKLLCVYRCATTIMNLLGMACESGVPAADDFVPVLVYVLIKANPPSLLSTVQYVNSFYGNRMEGEEQYWWIQFCSAIEFIKTMDYND